MDSIREFGNLGVHLIEDIQNEEPLDVTDEEAHFTIQAAKELAEAWFIEQIRTDEMIAHLEAKKKRFKKPVSS